MGRVGTLRSRNAHPAIERLRRATAFLVLFAGAVSGCASEQTAAADWIWLNGFPDPPTPRHLDEVYSAVVGTVRDEFYDPELRGLDWSGLARAHRQAAIEATSWEEFTAVVQALLAHLQTSHTRFLTPVEPAYHQLLSIFEQGSLGPSIRPRYRSGVVRYPGIGVLTEKVDDQWFVSGVLESGPGDRAGLERGDRLVAADGAPFHPLRSFLDLVDHTDFSFEQPSILATMTSELLVQRRRDGPLTTLSTSVEWIDPARLFLDAARQSTRIVERGGVRCGVVHFWSYAGDGMHDVLLDALAAGTFRDADALIVDLRGGWGGANPENLNIFHTRVPVLSHRLRNGEILQFDRQWRRPAAVLVDGGSRSGKEVYAWAFQRFDFGPVIGERTAGAVVGGSPFLLPHGCVLYLAVRDAWVDGERLEGVGVQPDIVIENPLPYSAGEDPVLDAAMQWFAEQGHGPRQSS